LAGFRDVLRNRSFLCLWLGQIVANFGERLTQMALVALVYSKAPGSTIELAKIFFFVVIPVFVIGPLAGVYVDRWDRKRVMIISDISRGALLLVIPLFLSLAGNFLPIYVTVFLIFAITRFFYLSKMAIIPDLVPKEMLLIANTLSDTTKLIATFIGIAIAGIIVERIGALNAFYINAFTYFISALLLSNMVVKRIINHFKEDILLAKDAIRRSFRKSIWAEIKEGMKYIYSHPRMRFISGSFFLVMAASGAISCVTIVFIQETFDSVTSDLSILFMFLGMGAFLGAMTYGRFGQKIIKSNIISLCMVAAGFFIAAFALTAEFTKDLRLSSAVIFLTGLCVGPIIVSLNTMAHEIIPPETRGRIFSSLECVINLGFLTFMFVAASLAEYTSNVWILTACGILLFFGGGIIFLVGRKGV